MYTYQMYLADYCLKHFKLVFTKYNRNPSNMYMMYVTSVSYEEILSYTTAEGGGRYFFTKNVKKKKIGGGVNIQVMGCRRQK